ncbi:hypothetical protein A2363_01425 [Candidatus Gottesmanbacteria bacterium RIFOXYB1_FULL_47_11]|uniref:Sortase n=1 Tax=Candidatus Gottesmanbacteria bacterium RIFOXYB1_FULL_47_11 TaxID=1798401 RepID=A0A1F6BDV4_9BACT|nr:MAG: hypothetical protein A2363_01425 [Candidatus Gottesmanbacteria bacterium RIFOXYB1_FULL_47_11]
MPKRIAPYHIGIVILVLALVFVAWLLSVLLPIIEVEITYRYKKVLRDTFAVSDIRGLILPQFRFDFRGITSTHTTDGITIPAVFIDEPVVYNVDPNNRSAYLAALGQGVAHASGTAFPGIPRLGYYFAHSSTPNLVRQYNAVFYLLGKLNPGDEIYIWHAGDRFDYKVTEKKITAPDDVSFLQTNSPAETIVLQTCWPPGTTLQRLLVFAARTQ